MLRESLGPLRCSPVSTSRAASQPQKSWGSSSTDSCSWEWPPSQKVRFPPAGSPYSHVVQCHRLTRPFHVAKGKRCPPFTGVPRDHRPGSRAFPRVAPRSCFGVVFPPGAPGGVRLFRCMAAQIDFCFLPPPRSTLAFTLQQRPETLAA